MPGSRRRVSNGGRRRRRKAGADFGSSEQLVNPVTQQSSSFNTMQQPSSLNTMQQPSYNQPQSGVSQWFRSLTGKKEDTTLPGQNVSAPQFGGIQQGLRTHGRGYLKSHPENHHINQYNNNEAIMAGGRRSRRKTRKSRRKTRKSRRKSRKSRRRGGATDSRHETQNRRYAAISKNERIF